MTLEDDAKPERVMVPLVMLPGNMDVLLKNELRVAHISLQWSNEFPEAVVLIVGGVDREQADELGFKTKRQSD